VVAATTTDSEPGVVAGSGCEVYVDAPPGLLSSLPTSPSDVYASSDGGGTWTKASYGMRSLFPGGGDASLAIDPGTGELGLADLWLGDTTVSTSSDGGQSWTSNPLGSLVLEDRPWLAAAGNGVYYLAYHQVPLGIMVARSVAGILYPLPEIAATALDQGGCICPSGNVITMNAGGSLGTGDVGVIYTTSSGGVMFARSTDGGSTFSQRTIAANQGDVIGFPIVAQSSGNDLIAVWNVETAATNGGTSAVFESRSGDWGSTWSPPTALVTAGGSVYPWVAANGSTVAVSMYHTTTTTAPDSAPKSASWYETAMVSTDGGASFSPIVVADPSAVTTGVVCTAGTSCSSGRELGDFQSVAIGSGGRVYLSYVNSLANASSGANQVRLVAGAA
jgi:hypothetical protein